MQGYADEHSARISSDQQRSKGLILQWFILKVCNYSSLKIMSIQR